MAGARTATGLPTTLPTRSPGLDGEVPLPDDPDLSPGQLEDLLARSHAGEPKEFRVSVDAFHDLMDGEAQ